MSQSESLRQRVEQHKPKNRNSFVEMYVIRSQVRAVAEEVVLHDVVRQFH